MNTSRILTLALALVLGGAGVGLWSYPASLAAAEAEAESSNETDTDAPDDEAASGTPSTEVFIPTEEISEDFAVSFPVDI